MKMQRTKFRIGELATRLNVERFVVRFWEKEFSINSTRSQGGQRFYSDKDAKKFFRIKELLYEQGFTIAGAKKQLALEKGSTQKIIASQKTDFTTTETTDPQTTAQTLEQQIAVLQKKLLKLRELL